MIIAMSVIFAVALLAVAVAAPGAIRAHRRARRLQDMHRAFTRLNTACNLTAKQLNEFGERFIDAGEALRAAGLGVDE